MLDKEKYYQAVAFRLSNEEDSLSGIDAIGFIDIDDFIAAGEPEDYITDDKIEFVPVSELTVECDTYISDDIDYYSPCDLFLQKLFRHLTNGVSRFGYVFNFFPFVCFIGEEYAYSSLTLQSFLPDVDEPYQRMSYFAILQGKSFSFLWHHDGLVYWLDTYGALYNDDYNKPDSDYLPTFPEERRWSIEMFRNFFNAIYYYSRTKQAALIMSDDVYVDPVCAGQTIYKSSRTDAAVFVPLGTDLMAYSSLRNLVGDETCKERFVSLPSSLKGVFPDSFTPAGFKRHSKIKFFWTPIVTCASLEDSYLLLDKSSAIYCKSPYFYLERKRFNKDDFDGLDISYAQDITGLFGCDSKIGSLDLSSLKFTRHTHAYPLLDRNLVIVNELILPPEFGYCLCDCISPQCDSVLGGKYIGKLDLRGIKLDSDCNCSYLFKGVSFGHLILDADDFAYLSRGMRDLVGSLVFVHARKLTIYLPSDPANRESLCGLISLYKMHMNFDFELLERNEVLT